MSEQSFNPGEVEPLKVNFISEEKKHNNQEEHLDGNGTPPTVVDTQPGQVAPNTPQVHAAPQDSDERYRNLQAAFTKVSQEKSELVRRLDQLEARLAQTPIPQQQFNQQSEPTPAKSDELDTMAEEFPELKPIASRMVKHDELINSQQEIINKQQTSLDTMAQQTAQDRQNQAILQQHPDAYEIGNSIDFQGWLVRQASYMQEWMNSGSAEQVIDLFSMYKRSPGYQQIQQQPQQQMQQMQQQLNSIDEARIAGAPQGNSAPILDTNNSNQRTWTTAEIDTMGFDEYQKLEGELDKAAREGRIIQS